MNRWYLSLLVVALPAVVLAQYSSSQYRESTPYQPAVPPPSINMGYGGYGYNTGASTAAGSAMNGMANAISAKGNYNLSTSAAAINMTQAQRNEIQNHQMYEDTYFQMRSQNEAWQKAHQKPTPTQEQMARWAREEAPQPLNPKQVDQSGNLNWPPRPARGRFCDAAYGPGTTHGQEDGGRSAQHFRAVGGAPDDRGHVCPVEDADPGPADVGICGGALLSAQLDLCHGPQRPDVDGRDG